MITFKDKPHFVTCYTPIEMFKLGVFGGAYFQLETELPQSFIDEAGESLTWMQKPDKKNNCYGVISGSSLEWWTEMNLINAEDPNGWVEWYIKFYYGRRHLDDERQIQRFRSFIARHVGMMRSYESMGRDSAKTKQNLLQWAWDYRIDPKK